MILPPLHDGGVLDHHVVEVRLRHLDTLLVVHVVAGPLAATLEVPVDGVLRVAADLGLATSLAGFVFATRGTRTGSGPSLLLLRVAVGRLSTRLLAAVVAGGGLGLLVAVFVFVVVFVLLRRCHRLGCVLLLLVLLLLEFVLVQVSTDLHNLIERGCVLDAIEEPRLRTLCDRDVQDTKDTQLEVQVDAVEESHLGDSTTLCQFEDVHVVQTLVPKSEVPAESGVLGLDESFDTSILNDIDDRQDVVRRIRIDVRAAGKTAPLLVNVVGSVQCVGDFVSDEHVVEVAAHVLPDGKSEDAGDDIE